MDWKRIFTREYTVQYAEIALRMAQDDVKHLLSFTMQNNLMAPDNKNICCYFEENEEKKYIEAIVKDFSSTKEKFDSFVKRFFALGTSYVEFSKGISEKNLAKLDKQELKELYLDYYKKAVDYTCDLFVAFALNDYWTEQGQAIAKGLPDEITMPLFRPTKKSTILKMQVDGGLIDLQDAAQINAFLEKYGWISCLDLQNPPWTKKDVEEFVKGIIVQEEKKAMPYGLALEKIGLRHKALFDMIKELAYIKDLRDDFRRKGVFYIQSLYKEISKKLNIDYLDLIYLTRDEITGLLDGNRVENKGGKRRTGFLLYTKNGKVVCIDHDIEGALKEIGFKEHAVETTEIKGLIANRGKAIGTVKIVRTVHDILKVNKGDILIAVTTHPDYVMAMQKAAAIVTDEGGITSHAAIVAREFGIPCIVGTKIATKVFNYGDKVEVDATKGTVKKL